MRRYHASKIWPTPRHLYLCSVHVPIRLLTYVLPCWPWPGDLLCKYVWGRSTSCSISRKKRDHLWNCPFWHQHDIFCFWKHDACKCSIFEEKERNAYKCINVGNWLRDKEHFTTMAKNSKQKETTFMSRSNVSHAPRIQQTLQNQYWQKYLYLLSQY